MMKRRWSNNGGFALRMLEESSSEVTSSSAALVMSPGMTMSPTSLSSPEYNELELWGYEENSYSHHGIVANNGNANNVSAGGGGGNMGNGGNGGVVISNNGALTVVANNGAVTVVANGLAGVNGGVLAANLLNAGNGGSNNTLNNLALGNCILGAGNGSNGGGGGGGGGVGIQGSQNMISTPLPSIIQNSMMNNNTPRSESANSISSGREDLSPSSSLNGYTPDGVEAKKPKKGPAPRQQEELCLVCGDRASGYHYNALTCEGCKGFFRRSVTKNAVYCCKFGHECEMDMYMRRKCQECRLKKCLAVGMRPECVVPENQCAIKRKEKKAQKEKDKQTNNNSVSTTNNSYKIDILPQLMKCDPPPHAALALLPEKLLNENRSRNIPQLTANQMAVIYKLIWYQDGYEQPSEEDLKRIMINSPGDEEDQHDVHFRHITEITILTVQLIVEFAKGLPAFTKIPQEDQITLLKACSSEVMMLRMARRYDAASDSILFANNRSYTRDSYRMAGMAETIEDLLHFCRQMYSMTVDNVEYALLTAIVIFSDRPGLEQADLVEQIQSYYIETLKIYIVNRHGGDTKCGVLFAKLLSILTELRTLGNQNSEMCFSLKLKNRKLPRFLEEIWDVQDVSTNIQASNIIATAASPTPQQQQQQQTIQVVPNPNMINSSNNSNINSNINNSSGTGSIGGGGSASGNTLIIGNNNNNSNSNNSSSNIVVSGVSVVTSQSSSSSSSVSSQNEQQHV